jgi:hypothetical protein
MPTTLSKNPTATPSAVLTPPSDGNPPDGNPAPISTPASNVGTPSAPVPPNFTPPQPSNPAPEREAVMITGQVVTKDGGLKGVYVDAGEFGAAGTDTLGGFSLLIPKDARYSIQLSRTGYGLLPSRFEGVAQRNLVLLSQGLELSVVPKGCKQKDITSDKVALQNALAELQKLLGKDRRIRRTIQTSMSTLKNLPEVFLSCSTTCIKAELTKSSLALTSGNKLIAAAVNNAIRNNKGLSKSSVRRLSTLRSTITTRIRRIPSTTFLCQ